MGLVISLRKYPPITQAITDGHIDQCNLSENKKYLVGVNVFFDYDEEENSRGSVFL